jgi:hypothetical protein
MYPSPTYSFLTQVRNGTGYAREARTADAMAMSLWPSRGLDLYGFEVKVSRTDWMKELMQPDKADAIAQYCDYWYLVIGDPDIVQQGELPKTWGLIIPDKKKGLRQIVEPKKLKPKQIDRITLAGIMRNVAERTIAKDLIEAELEKARDKGKEWGKYEIERLGKDLTQLRGAIQAFEKAAGVQLHEWPESNKEIGQAVKQVLEGKHLKAGKKMRELLERAENIVKFLKDEPVDEWKM